MGRRPGAPTCSVEETVNGPDVGPDFADQGPDYLERHGYLYEVDPNWGPNQHPKVLPVKNVGRFAHEAAAVDPRTGILYLTEDSFEFPSGIYRYRAPVNAMRARAIVDGGTLEMLRVKGSSAPVELGGVLEVGSTYDVDWVTIPEPDFDGGGATNDDAIRIVSQQGFAQNAAKFARPEGVYYSKGDVFFTCTRGGSTSLAEVPNAEYGNGRGQVWCLDPREGELTLLFQSTDPPVLDLPDNMTISPRGTIVLCEDGTDGNFIRLLAKEGALVDFARNNIGPSERRVRRGHDQPGRPDAVREHPVGLRPHVRHLAGERRAALLAAQSFQASARLTTLRSVAGGSGATTAGRSVPAW